MEAMIVADFMVSGLCFDCEVLGARATDGATEVLEPFHLIYSEAASAGEVCRAQNSHSSDSFSLESESSGESTRRRPTAVTRRQCQLGSSAEWEGSG